MPNVYWFQRGRAITVLADLEKALEELQDLQDLQGLRINDEAD